LDQLDTTPDQAIYVGDNFYADAVGAQFAGLIAILADPNQIFPNAGCRRIADISELLSFSDGLLDGISEG
jgi:FMN phosphatase YigB (HAD superfamily)